MLTLEVGEEIIALNALDTLNQSFPSSIKARNGQAAIDLKELVLPSQHIRGAMIPEFPIS